MQQRRRNQRAEWIRRTHLFHADAFVCSFCMASFPEPYEICPSCGAIMKKIKVDPSWVDEAEDFLSFMEDE